MTPEQFAIGYFPCVRQKLASYDPLLRTKITTDGPSAMCFWGVDGAERSMPSDWRSERLQIRGHVSHLWRTLNATDLQVVSKNATLERACHLFNQGTSGY